MEDNLILRFAAYLTVEDILTAKLKDKSTISKVYHYASPEAMINILQNEKFSLRFSRYDCLNDTSEGQYILSCYQNACNQLHNYNKIDDEFFELVKNCIPNNRTYFMHKIDPVLFNNKIIDSTLSRSEFTPYVCCFSLDSDSLPMWNYYVKDFSYQGYSLGFNFLNDIKLSDSIKDGYRLWFFDVIYDNEVIINAFKNMLLYVYDFRKDRSYDDSILDLIADVLTDSRLRVKSQHFSHEKEVRAILYLPKEPLPNATSHDDFEINYRSKNGYIIPYVDLSFDKSCLESITIGPLIEHETAKASMEDFLKDRGYNANVYSSTVPIRY